MNLLRQIILVELYSLALPTVMALDVIYNFSGFFSNKSPMLKAFMLYFIQIIIPYFVLCFSLGSESRNVAAACIAWTIAAVVEIVFIRTIGGVRDIILSIITPSLKWNDPGYYEFSNLIDIVLILLYAAISLAYIVVISNKREEI